MDWKVERKQIVLVKSESGGLEVNKSDTYL